MAPVPYLNPSNNDIYDASNNNTIPIAPIQTGTTSNLDHSSTSLSTTQTVTAPSHQPGYSSSNVRS